MPYRRRTFRRRRLGLGLRRRRTFRRRFMRRRNPMRRSVRNNCIVVKDRVSIPVNSDGGGNIFFGFNYNGLPASTNANSAMIYDFANAGGYAFTQASNFVNVYSQVRCMGMSMKFIPSAPNDIPTVGFKPLYFATDPDGFEATATSLSEPDIMSVPKLRIRNLWRPAKQWTRTLKYGLSQSKIPTFYAGGGPSPNQNIMGMWHSTQTPVAQTSAPFGIHQCMASYVNVATSGYGQLIVTGYFAYKDYYNI
ncbi:capsid [uncultured virus]|uniref:Capsid n=1 Tax=uncultured virus TaxID=340016 RepID=A0A2K9LT36_9VIRU|nr:capsid [uncultured virus]